ncbi:MAG TPA: hypothetical protein VGO47_06925, partial [Chlamydiales bacterium]|nr:hypothetical protein [Chlamydiales bacterium]
GLSYLIPIKVSHAELSSYLIRHYRVKDLLKQGTDKEGRPSFRPIQTFHHCLNLSNPHRALS